MSFAKWRPFCLGLNVLKSAKYHRDPRIAIDVWYRSHRLCYLSWTGIFFSWASYQIRKIAGCACAGNAGNVFPHRRFQRKPLVSDPGMHHGTCKTHVPWCMSGSLTCGDGENVPGIPGSCAPAILRIWQEAHVLIAVHCLIIIWITTTTTTPPLVPITGTQFEQSYKPQDVPTEIIGACNPPAQPWTQVSECAQLFWLPDHHHRHNHHHHLIHLDLYSPE